MVVPPEIPDFFQAVMDSARASAATPSRTLRGGRGRAKKKIWKMHSRLGRHALRLAGERDCRGKSEGRSHAAPACLNDLA